MLGDFHNDWSQFADLMPTEAVKFSVVLETVSTVITDARIMLDQVVDGLHWSKRSKVALVSSLASLVSSTTTWLALDRRKPRCIGRRGLRRVAGVLVHLRLKILNTLLQAVDRGQQRIDQHLDLGRQL